MRSIDLNTFIASFGKLMTNLNFTINKVKHEKIINNVYVNVQSICMGAYFRSNNNDLTIWIGHWEKHGFCISFFSKTIRTIDSILKKYLIDFCSDYSVFKDDEDYWYTIKFSTLLADSEKLLKTLNGETVADIDDFEKELLKVIRTILEYINKEYGNVALGEEGEK